MHLRGPHGTSAISRMQFTQNGAGCLFLPRGSPAASLATVLSRLTFHRSVPYVHSSLQVPVNAFCRNLTATTRPGSFWWSQRVRNFTVSHERHTPIDFRAPSGFLSSAVSGTNMESTAAEQPATRTSVLVQNGEWEACPKSSAEFLASSPRGAYTTARTVNRHSVFEFEFHVARLVQSVTLMMEANEEAPGGSADYPQLLKVELLRPLLLGSLTVAMKAYQEVNGGDVGELKLTFLLTWEAKHHHVYVHVSPLPPPPSPPILVEVQGHPRSNAAAKDSEWVRQRKSLEEKKGVGVNEVLLMDTDGSILEGMSSNFGVIVNGALVTPEEGVLLGTVRGLVLSVCKCEGVEVVLRAPNVSEADTWEGAFVSSTSRLLLPIDEIRIQTAAGTKVLKFKPSIIHKLSTLVREQVVANSTRVVEALLIDAQC